MAIISLALHCFVFHSQALIFAARDRFRNAQGNFQRFRSIWGHRPPLKTLPKEIYCCSAVPYGYLKTSPASRVPVNLANVGG